MLCVVIIETFLMKCSDKNCLKYCQQYIFDSTSIFLKVFYVIWKGDKYMNHKILECISEISVT